MKLPQDASFRQMVVAGSKCLGPAMQRLRLTGPDLARFDTRANLHLRLYVPQPGPQPWTMRYYTISDIDARAGWLDIDFVLHDHHGPASDFARSAQPGDPCAISGPCGLGVKPAARILLAGDETALPAIARIARDLPPDVTGEILIRTQLPLPCPLPRPEGMRLNIFAAARPFRDAVTEVTRKISAGGEDHFIWIAGEAADCTALTPALSHISKARRMNVPYWGNPPRKEPAA